MPRPSASRARRPSLATSRRQRRVARFRGFIAPAPPPRHARSPGAAPPTPALDLLGVIRPRASLGGRWLRLGHGAKRARKEGGEQREQLMLKPPPPSLSLFPPRPQNPQKQAVADIIRTTLGPRSMLKMLLDAGGGESLKSRRRVRLREGAGRPTLPPPDPARPPTLQAHPPLQTNLQTNPPKTNRHRPDQRRPRHPARDRRLPPGRKVRHAAVARAGRGSGRRHHQRRRARGRAPGRGRAPPRARGAPHGDRARLRARPHGRAARGRRHVVCHRPEGPRADAPRLALVPGDKVHLSLRPLDGRAGAGRGRDGGAGRGRR